MENIIQNQYTFNIQDIGNKKLIANYKNLTDEININIIGPNLRSTEIDNTHLYLRTSDQLYLNVKS